MPLAYGPVPATCSRCTGTLPARPEDGATGYATNHDRTRFLCYPCSDLEAAADLAATPPGQVPRVWPTA